MSQTTSNYSKQNIRESPPSRPRVVSPSQIKPWRKWTNSFVLIFVNFMNYTDRYIVAGVLIELQEEFKIRNTQAGLIQSIFIISYMLSAPLFGYFGDRYNRKYILAISVIIWNVSSLSCSFVSSYWWFLLFRAIFGLGQSCYSTVAPTYISDLFIGKLRSKIVAMFYVAIPMGSGFGYIISTISTEVFGDWKWSLRLTPIIGLFSTLILLFVLKEPKRGEIEGTTIKNTSLKQDISYLSKNRSFLYSTLGFTAVCFTTGSVCWWAPKLNYLGFKTNDLEVKYNNEGTAFGLVSLLAGFCGVLFGYIVTYKRKLNFPPMDPLVCSVGLLMSAPLMIGATYTTLYSKIWTYFLLFFGMIFLNLNCALTMDICLCVILPSRRSTAIGIQLLIGHTFGDAGSPYLTGLVADLILDYKLGNKENSEFYSLQYAYFIGCFVAILGGLFFFINALYIVSDAETLRKESENTRIR